MNRNNHLVARAGTAALRSSCVLGLLTTLLHAQARAPFTGIVRAENGKPIANAEVTCVFVPDSTAPGTPDRVTAPTDAGGAFRMQLVAGLAYVVWAMGPADAQGLRSVVCPQPDAAGGRKLDLTAHERRGPTKLRVTGSTAWIAEGPLALRLYVAGACVAGPDVVIPGDSVVSLPALPAAPCCAALVDGRGQAIQVRACSVSGDAAVAFADPHFVSVMAVDQNGKALAGVQVLQQLSSAGPAPGRLADVNAQPESVLRATGVTGPDGTATVCCAGEAACLLGRLQGHADCWSSWARSVPVHDGKGIADAGPPTFTLRPAEPRTLRVVGLAGEERVEVAFHAYPSLRTRNGVCAMPYELTAAMAGDGIHSADGLVGGVPVTAQVRFADVTAPPSRIVAANFLESAGFRDFDMAGLRRMTVTVVGADGHRMPCACLGVADIGCAPHICWRVRLVTDGEGRAELCMNRSGHWMVYATTGSAHALALVKVSDEAGPIEMKLTPLPVMKLRIVDGARRPVQGASLRCTGSSCGAGARQAESRALDGIAAVTTGSALWPLRSNAVGEIEVSFLERPAVTVHFKAMAGRLESEEVELRSGDEVQEIVVK
jgi:hypothetical protein